MLKAGRAVYVKKASVASLQKNAPKRSGLGTVFALSLSLS
jgi:hypothetical protein